MTSRSYSVLVVDDDEEAARELAVAIHEDLADLGRVETTPCTSFSEAVGLLESGGFDMVVLDVADQTGGDMDDHAGRTVYERISDVRWLPVVFYTGYPERVRELVEDDGLVRAVAKGNLAEAIATVRTTLESDVPTLTRGITAFVDKTVREFLRDYVSEVWAALPKDDQDVLPLVLLNRVAAKLRDDAVTALDEILGARKGKAVPTGAASRVYLYPPVTEHVTCGDLVEDASGARWLVLTPACDLYEDPLISPDSGDRRRRSAKVEFVRLTRAHELFEFPPVAALVSDAKGAPTRDRIKQMLTGKVDRYYLLPHYLRIPDLIVDLEHLTTEPLDVVRSWTRLATLDSPFVEQVLSQSARFSSRIGVPDLPRDHLWQRVKDRLDQSHGQN